MHRKSLIVAALVAGTMVAPSSAFAARGFSYGVSAAEVTSKSVLVWARPDKAGRYNVQISTDRRFRHNVKQRRVTASKRHDLTVQRRFRGLKSGKRYYYRFTGKHSQRSDVGSFRTAPSPRANATIRFAYSGDADAQKAAGASNPFWGSFAAYGQMARQHNHFNVNLGDTIYSDSEVPGQATPALTLSEKYAKYKQNLALKNLQRLRGTSGVYNEWDDHEFINDFSKAENGNTIYRAGLQAFRTYMPVNYRSPTGLYRSFRWGKNVEVFFLDERSFRSAKASANHVCDNPTTGAPDNAPTAPQSTRSAFALINPEFTQPVSAQCLAAINDPNRTMLGRSQLALFKRAVRNSSATWKVIMNEVPIQQFYALPYDRWEGYAAERQNLLSFLQKNVKNTIFLTTDVHANMVNDVRFQTLESGGPKNSGITEVTTGPVGTRTFNQEIDVALNRPGTGALVEQLFFKPQPPQGVGMTCVNTNVDSFGEVTANAKTLTVRLLDDTGKPVKDQSGSNCAPIRLRAK